MEKPGTNARPLTVKKNAKSAKKGSGNGKKAMRNKMEEEGKPQVNLPQFLTSTGYLAIPFRPNVVGQLLINARINEVDGLYIIDSGASQTVVDAKKTGILKLKLNHDETQLTGGGVGAHSLENVPSYNNQIEIDNFKLDNLVIAVMSLETAWEALTRAGADEDLSGIIGVDILKRGNAIIDFNSMTLYLMPPKSGDDA